MIAGIKSFFNSIAKGASGILTEIAFTVFFILAGLAVCIFWWELLK